MTQDKVVNLRGASRHFSKRSDRFLEVFHLFNKAARLDLAQRQRLNHKFAIHFEAALNRRLFRAFLIQG